MRAVWFLLLALGAGGCAGGPRPRQSVPDTLYAERPTLSGLDTGPLVGRRILIDPGHGGRFDGVEGLHRTREADVNLGVGLYLWGLLRDAGADVHLTRSSDRDLLPDGSEALREDLAARVAVLDSLSPDVFLSLHHNSNAELDRERNRIETYYKLGDDGPSFDLGRAVHERLATHLGIDEARLLPGNYFVLRGARTAAVLGEASYLSNPTVETQLRLAEKQMLEAEAYFLALLDYFAAGTGRWTRVAPPGDTLQAGGEARFRYDGTQALDPLSVRVEVDGAAVEAALDRERAEVALSFPAAGAHEVRVSGRNLRGNAARPWLGQLVVHASPAFLHLVQEPDPALPGALVRLTLRLEDASGQGVGDGIAVEITAQGLAIEAAESVTRDGTLLVVARATAGVPRLRVRAAGFEHELSVRISAAARRKRFVRLLDARTSMPIALATSRCGGTTRSDRAGWLQLDGGCDTLAIERRGYVPWLGVLPHGGGTVHLEPLYGGSLHGVVFALDPGTSDAQIEPFAVARALADRLTAAGARVVWTRGVGEEIGDLERVRVASRSGAHWFMRFESGAPAMMHYPGSVAGTRMAQALAAALARDLAEPFPVRADSRFVLQQTPCPAVVVRLPVSPASTLAGATSLFTGVRAAIDSVALPPLRIALEGDPAMAFVLLDGVENGIRDRDSLRFEQVRPGAHRVLVARSNGTVRWFDVQVTGSDTTRVRLPAN